METSLYMNLNLRVCEDAQNGQKLAKRTGPKDPTRAGRKSSFDRPPFNRRLPSWPINVFRGQLSNHCEGRVKKIKDSSFMRRNLIRMIIKLVNNTRAFGCCMLLTWNRFDVGNNSRFHWRSLNWLRKFGGACSSRLHRGNYKASPYIQDGWTFSRDEIGISLRFGHSVCRHMPRIPAVYYN